MRFMIEEHFASSRAKNIGLIVGLVFNDGAPRWFDVLLIKSSPVRHLCLGISPGSYYPMVNTEYGDFYPPKKFRVGLNGLVQNQSVCLLGHVLSLNIGEPLVMISPRKKCMEAFVDNGKSPWRMEVFDDFKIFPCDDCLSMYNAKKNKPLPANRLNGEREKRKLSAHDEMRIASFQRKMNSRYVGSQCSRKIKEFPLKPCAFVTCFIYMRVNF